MKPSVALPQPQFASHLRSLLKGLSFSLLCVLPPALATSSAGGDVMQGFPPAMEMRVNKANAFLPPYLRWSMRHAREVSPTRNILRAQTPLVLAAGPALALDGLPFTVGDETLTLDGYLRETVTDGLIVLHRGVIVFERYYDGFEPRQPHIWASMTKSVTGLLAAQFIA